MAVLSPYFPFPAGARRRGAHVQPAARSRAQFDVELFAFTDDDSAPNPRPCSNSARAWCWSRSRATASRAWSTLLPPEVHEFRSPAMRNAIARERRAASASKRLQVEYTQLALYGGDATSWSSTTSPSTCSADCAPRAVTLAAWWDWFRWRRFETRAVRAARRVVVMSSKDAEMLGPKAATVVIENGVDLARFEAAPETPGQRLLFHRLLPALSPTSPRIAFSPNASGRWCATSSRNMELTVVCGPDHLATGAPSPKRPSPPPIRAFACSASSPTCARSTCRSESRHRADHGLRRHQR
jgi:hypothetical protein